MKSKGIFMTEDFLLDTMTWSFSRLNYTCLREFKLHYIDCNQGIDSFFGQFGTFMHKILEMYAKGELSVFELSQYYEDHFDEEVWMDAPYNKYKDLKEDYFYKGLEYLDNIDLSLDDYDVLGVEKEVRFLTVGGRDMVGYIDLLLREKDTGRIIITDHKSATLKFLKSGKISKADLPHFEEFKRQLYLYSIPILEEYGRVDELMWNMFKDRRWIKIPFDKEEFKSAVKWAQEQLVKLYQEEEWSPKEGAGEKDFYCRNLCGQREICEYAQPEKKDEFFDFDNYEEAEEWDEDTRILS